MQSTLVVIARKAVKAALNGSWEEAIELNKYILEKNPGDLDAKIRLGRAFLQLGSYTEAKNCFKEVLAFDPINQVALKNYEMAKNKKVENNNMGSKKSLIKEPGTTFETIFEITDKRIKLSNISPGDELELKVLKEGVEVYTTDNRSLKLGILDKALSSKIYEAKKSKYKTTSAFIGQRENKVKILVKCDHSIFKSPKQEIKPYVKINTADDTSSDIND